MRSRRVPITGVEIKLGDTWLPLKRTVNNQWPYYNTNGPWQSSFPMPIRVTSVTGETVEDAITGVKGGQGTKQFGQTSGGGGGGSSVRAHTVISAPLNMTFAAAHITLSSLPTALQDGDLGYKGACVQCTHL